MNLQQAKQQYSSLTQKSLEFFQAAQQYTPGGVKGNVHYMTPHPLIMKHGEGSWLTDLDDRSYVDFLCSYGPMILGHGHPLSRQSVQQTWELYGSTLH